MLATTTTDRAAPRRLLPLLPLLLLALLVSVGCGDAASAADALAPDAGADADAARQDTVSADTLAADLGAADASPDAPSALNVAVDNAASALVTTQQLVGLGVGVVHNGALIHLAGYGLADREDKRPVNARATLFRWASISKTATAVIALRLAKAGTLTLDETLAALLPGYSAPTTFVEPCNGQTTRSYKGQSYSCSAGLFELPLAAAEQSITLTQLLGHLGGITHYSNGKGSPLPPDALARDPKVNTGVAWALGYLTDKPLVAVPGARYSYSTFGFNLAGAALAARSGQSFAALIQAHVAGPSGASSIAPDHEWLASPQRAAGYAKLGNTIVRQGSSDVSWKLPGGGVHSTVEDLARYCRALDDNTLLDAALAAQAFTAQKTSGGKSTGYGLGFDPGSRAGRRFVQHSGSQQKARTRLRLYLDDHLCIVVMSNSTYADTAALVDGIEDAVRPLL